MNRSKRNKKKANRRADLWFQRKNRRSRKKQRRTAGHAKFMSDVRALHPKIKIKKETFFNLHKRSKVFQSPLLSENIRYFLNKKDCFALSKIVNANNVFLIPSIFSLSDNYTESSVFIRKFINALYKQSFSEIIIDYQKCSRIDIDASICMDIILYDFTKYYDKCISKGQHIRVNKITPRNYNRHEIEKILFSIGAFSNIRGFKISFDNIIEYPLCVGDKSRKDSSKVREVHITEMVDYIIACLSKMNRNLTAKAEDDLYKVIGEVIINAEEHSDTNKRFSIGYFEQTHTSEKNVGIFNIAILNFGNSIYETFKSPTCKNLEVKKQMEDLSKKYTKKNFFRKSKFEEESLWTLYALQEGVTRKEDWKRGNGSIRFIESFFKLKGDSSHDDVSQMIITSGHTQIIFNGKYQIVETPRGKEGQIYKMMTFNNSGNIEEMPDENFVTFTDNYFPGWTHR